MGLTVTHFQKMATSVEGLPLGQDRFGDIYNNDPGVYEPECDWNEDQGGYPDTQQFLEQFQAIQEEQKKKELLEAQQEATTQI